MLRVESVKVDNYLGLAFDLTEQTTIVSLVRGLLKSSYEMK